mgnify:CR=1 FL=1
MFSPSDFVAVFNQTLEYAYPTVSVEGELANLRVARNKWVYFDVKDSNASLKCFGTVYNLPGPLEDGMLVRVVASPRLHPLYNLSLNIQSIVPVGEGSIKRASDLLKAKLAKEGLFEPSRKRSLPYAPEVIGLIASSESAAYGDFVKVLQERWSGMTILHYDSQVQGDSAPADLVRGIESMNQLANPPEVLVITRGGGSADDLAVFNSENLVRAVASSRIPTLVAIGHEVDFSLAELAADLRASTPSNAAELLTPDKRHVIETTRQNSRALTDLALAHIETAKVTVTQTSEELKRLLENAFSDAEQTFLRQSSLLEALNPTTALKRGYAVIRAQGKVIKSANSLKANQLLNIEMHDGSAEATVNKVHL